MGLLQSARVRGGIAILAAVVFVLTALTFPGTSFAQLDNLGIDSAGNVTLPSGGTITAGPRGSNLPIGPNGLPSVDAFANQFGNPVFGGPIVNNSGDEVTPAGGTGGGGGAGAAEPEATPPTTIGDQGSVMYYLYALLFGIGSFVVKTGAILFQIGVDDFVAGFGSLYLNEGFGLAVENVWAIVRDLFNLSLIFGLVFIGFRLILSADDSNAKRMLVLLIGAALLVNFSLFITKFIVDIANSAASVIYTRGLGGGGVADLFMNQLQLGTVLNNAGASIDDIWTRFAYLFSGFAIMLIAGFVFAAGGILLMIRFIVLLMYLVFSPIMFLGWVFPFFANLSRRYWSGFLSQAFMAPAYLLMLYLSFQVIQSYASLRAGTNLADIALNVDNVQQVGDVLGFFALAMFFLILSLVVAKQMGAVGATAAISVGNNLRGRVQRGLTYVPRELTRSGVNRASEAAENRLNRAQARERTSRSGRLFSSALNSNLVDRTVRGATQKGQNARLGGVATTAENRAYREKTQARSNQTRGEMQREQNLASALTTTAENNTASVTELTDAMATLSTTIRGMTLNEKMDLGFDRLQDERVAIHLTDTELERMEQSGRYSSQQIADIRTARNNGFASVAQRGSTVAAGAGNANVFDNTFVDTQRQAIVNRSVQDVGRMPVNVFTDYRMARYITPPMLEQRMRNGGITNAQLATIRTNIEAHANSSTTPNNVRNMWRQWTANSFYGAQLGLNIP